MSMIGNFLMIDHQVKVQMEERKLSVADYIYEVEHPKEEMLDINKYWEEYYTFFGETKRNYDKVIYKIFGEKEITDEEVGFTAAQLVDKETVKEIAKQLVAVYEREKDEIEESTIEDDEFLFDIGYIEEIMKFFKEASQRDMHILFYIN